MKNLLYITFLSIILLSCESREHRMYRLAQKAVRARFKNPDEPKFSANPDSVFYNADKNYFIVLGRVETQNLLGVPLTDRWFVTLKGKTAKPDFNKDDNWSVFDVEFQSEMEKEEKAQAELMEKKAIHIVKTNAKYDDILNGYSIYATVENTSDKILDYGTLQATFYDKNNNAIGVGSGYIDNLSPYQTRVVEITATDIRGAGRYVVEVNDVNFH
ncbi:MAG: hypothetical protein JSS96_02015 [Bacteroidetes bacterium]|nr:hypothetical protein [Bacteroidota bacterium]